MADQDKKTYYVIRRGHSGAGFFSNYYWVLGHVVNALSQGMIPLVDMENYETFYNEKEAVNGTQNAWYYYFQNPSGADLHKVYESGDYVLSEDKYRQDLCSKYCLEYGFPTGLTIDYYQKFIEEYLQIRPELVKGFERDAAHQLMGRNAGPDTVQADAQRQGLDGSADLESTVLSSAEIDAFASRTLAVHVRGTDMRKSTGATHYAPLPPDAFVKAAEKLMSRYHYDHVFLASDEEAVISQFRAVFGEKLITFDEYRAGEGEKTGLHEQQIYPRPLHKYLLGLEILRDAWFMAKCGSLVCGLSNVTNMAITWNRHGYRKVELVSETNRGMRNRIRRQHQKDMIYLRHYLGRDQGDL